MESDKKLSTSNNTDIKTLGNSRFPGYSESKKVKNYPQLLYLPDCAFTNTS